VLEIGPTLRAARIHRGIELAEVERKTKIRTRQLIALEEERFDALPGRAYARSFLKEYAEFLGLEANRYVEEFDTRFADAEPEPLVPSRQRLVGPLLPTHAATALMLALVVVAISIAAWRFESGHAPPATKPTRSHRPTVTSVSPPLIPAGEVTARTAPPRPRLARLVLIAARGNCWLLVRDGSGAGPILYQGLLSEGQSLRFARRHLWIRVGAPWNLDARLNGAALASLRPDTGNVLVTPTGTQPVPAQ
jgi:transcriptional regulator with XRE-family HTH domain